ncbi:MAG: alpha/beta hydrolase [Muribaculaceae bacterium]|nr:alpha/beta hydrolase [Muribaculaceae bacterium]
MRVSNEQRLQSSAHSASSAKGRRGLSRYWRWGGALVVLVMLLVIAASCYMLHYALAPLQRSASEAYARLIDRTPQMQPWLQQEKGNLRDTTIIFEGKQLHAIYLPADTPTTCSAVLVHGYKDCSISMLHIGWLYHEHLGLNILLPDLSAHGQSDGDHIGMGWQERRQVAQWAGVAADMWRNDSVPSRVVLHGVSMGAATVMDAAGDSLPTAVKAVIEDCGYTSAWDEFAGQMQEQFGLHEMPLLYTTSALCRVRYGWSFGQASPITQVAKCHLPMLFIHGGNDTFVPTAMVHRLYAAKPQPKALWIAPGSEHARAFTDHEHDYERVVRQFLDTYFY